MKPNWFALGAITGGIAVALGAFGAHALKESLSVYHLDVFEVGVRYQMYHSLALLAVAWATTRFPGKLTNAAGWLFLTGIIIFSGSLYLLALTDMRWLGAITPIGGACFILGWLALMLASVKQQ